MKKVIKDFIGYIEADTSITFNRETCSPCNKLQEKDSFVTAIAINEARFCCSILHSKEKVIGIKILYNEDTLKKEAERIVNEIISTGIEFELDVWAENKSKEANNSMEGLLKEIKTIIRAKDMDDSEKISSIVLEMVNGDEDKYNAIIKILKEE